MFYEGNEYMVVANNTHTHTMAHMKHKWTRQLLPVNALPILGVAACMAHILETKTVQDSTKRVLDSKSVKWSQTPQSWGEEVERVAFEVCLAGLGSHCIPGPRASLSLFDDLLSTTLHRAPKHESQNNADEDEDEDDAMMMRRMRMIMMM